MIMKQPARRAVAFLLVGLATANPLAGQVETRTSTIRSSQEAPDRPATEEGQSVPILSDIPLLSFLFQSGRATTVQPLGQGRSRLRIPLGHPGWKDPDPESGKLGFLETWLARELPRAVSGLEEVGVVFQSRRSLGLPPGSEREIPYLEVTGPAAAIEEARTFLDAVLRADSRMIEVSFTIVDVGLEGATRDGKVTCEVLDRGGLEHMLGQRKKSGDGTVLMAPTLLMLNGQQGSVSVINQEAYVKDFEVEVAQGCFIADPVIDVIKEGIVLDCGAVLDPRGQGLSFEAEVSISTLMRPIRTFKTRLVQNSEEVTIQLPEVRYSKWGSEPILLGADDGGFVVRGLSYWKQNGDDDAELSILEVYCQVTVIDRPEVVDASGVVIAFDAASRVATVRANARGEPEGPDLSFIRGSEFVGRGTIIERQGSLLLVRVSDGAPRAGDHAQ